MVIPTDGQVSRRTARNLAVGYLILLVFVAGSMWALEKRADHRIVIARAKAEAQIRGSLINACERVNVLRGQLNTLILVAYSAWNDGVKRERALATMGDRDVHLRSARRLAATRDKMRITDLTDCEMAVTQGFSYRAPRPRPITPEDLR